MLKERSLKEMEANLPGVLPAATLAFLTYMSSPEGQPPTRLYGNEPWTYTRCSEQIDGYNLVVGGFAPAGPLAYHNDTSTSTTAALGLRGSSRPLVLG